MISKQETIKRIDKLKLQINSLEEKKEIRTLKEAMESKDSVFLAVYGRRRVGKTFLLRQKLSDGIYPNIMDTYPVW